MKIIQVMPEFKLAGAEIMCENLAYQLKKRGHDVLVLSMYDTRTPITERMERAGVKIRYLHKKSGLDFSLFKRMKKIFEEEKPDVVHTHLYSIKYAAPTARKAKIRGVVHTVHNVAQKEQTRLGKLLNRSFFKKKGVIPVALSKLIQTSVIEEYGMKASQVPVAFNGIDLSKCQPKEGYERGKKFTILHIGRFFEQKNHKGLIEAFRLFHEQKSDSELWLIGEGEKKAEIQALVENYGLCESVKFLGLQSNVYGFLQSADVFTLPSKYEGIPMTLIEAMGTGLPIVATAVGGVPDMLTDKENGLLVEGKPEVICAAFEAYYTSEGLRREHGERALARAQAFSAETMAKSYEEIYQRAIDHE